MNLKYKLFLKKKIDFERVLLEKSLWQELVAGISSLNGGKREKKKKMPKLYKAHVIFMEFFFNFLVKPP